MAEDGQPKRIFFGSLEHAEKERLAKGETNNAEDKMQVDDAPVATQEFVSQPTESLPLEEKTQRDIARHQRLLDSLETKQKMRELAIPTEDELVKARLVELREPMILFGEGKPERRERLRGVMAERGITEGMPTVLRPHATPFVSEQQAEAFAAEGSEILKEARLKLVRSSLSHARDRLNRRREAIEDFEQNWDEHEKNFSHLYNHFSSYTEVSSTVADTRPISYVSFSPDGNLLASSSWSSKCKLWDAQSKKCIRELNGHTERAQCIEFYHKIQPPSTMNLASCGADRKIYLWNLESKKPIQSLDGHWDRVNRVVFHPHHPWLASTSFDKTWCLWDLETGKEILTQGGNSRAVYGLAIHPDGALVITGGMDSVARLWDVRSGRVIWNLRGHAKKVIGLDVAPNGYHVATGSDDHTVRIWDLRKRKTANILLAHNSLISTVKYQPNYGNFIITSGFDNLCKIWSTKSWSCVKILTGHESKITCFAMSPHTTDPEGHPVSEPYKAPIRFVSSSFDRTFKFWEQDPLAYL
jgi:U4/U6 small nuclear ribonucleoprotein PRP4